MATFRGATLSDCPLTRHRDDNLKNHEALLSHGPSSSPNHGQSACTVTFEPSNPTNGSVGVNGRSCGSFSLPAAALSPREDRPTSDAAGGGDDDGNDGDALPYMPTTVECSSSCVSSFVSTPISPSTAAATASLRNGRIWPVAGGGQPTSPSRLSADHSFIASPVTLCPADRTDSCLLPSQSHRGRNKVQDCSTGSYDCHLPTSTRGSHTNVTAAATEASFNSGFCSSIAQDTGRPSEVEVHRDRPPLEADVNRHRAQSEVRADHNKPPPVIEVDRANLLSALSKCFSRKADLETNSTANTALQSDNTAPTVVRPQYSSGADGADSLWQSLNRSGVTSLGCLLSDGHMQDNNQSDGDSCQLVKQQRGRVKNHSATAGVAPFFDPNRSDGKSTTDTGDVALVATGLKEKGPPVCHGATRDGQQNRRWDKECGEEGGGGNVCRHSSLNRLVAIGTRACSLSVQPSSQESYLCGSAISLLPPIVERTENEVASFQPIKETSTNDVTVAMFSGGDQHKTDDCRGTKVNAEPFFVCNKSLAWDRQATLSHTPYTQQADIDDVSVSKVRKLPTFTLRQTTNLASNSSQKTNMSSKTGAGHTGKTQRKKPGVCSERELTKSQRAANTANKPMAVDFHTNQPGTFQGDIPEVNIVCAPAHKERYGNKAVFDLSMEADTIRVDISDRKKTIHDNGSNENPVTTASVSDRKTCTVRSDNMHTSPRHSLSEEDEFSQDGKSFREWSGQKSGRNLPRQNQSRAQGSPEDRKQHSKVPFTYIKPRTSSDGDLLHKVKQQLVERKVLDVKRPAVDQVYSPIPLQSSNSETALSPSRRHSLAVSLESERVRRNSVSILHGRPSKVPSSISCSSSPSDHAISAPRRRHSSKSTLEKFLKQDNQPASSSACDIAVSLEFLTWTHLLSTYSQNELDSATVRKAEIVVTLPVCHVTKAGSTISVSSVEAIQQTLYHFHPNLQVLLGSMASETDHSPFPQPPAHTSPKAPEGVPIIIHTDETPKVEAAHDGVKSLPHTLEFDVAATSREESMTVLPTASLAEDINDEMTELNEGGRRQPVKRQQSNHSLYLKPEETTRRVSINTCIRTMREGSGNYDSQLIGCQNVGTYADEETLKVVLAKSDAISCVISAMKAFLHKEELQRQACASLLKMASTSEANCIYISQNGGVTAITNTMRRYQDNVDVTRLALSILGYISTTEDVKAELLSCGCHSDVLATMSRHSEDRMIVCQCCFILGNLVISVDTAQQLMLVGGVHTIISMLNRYHDDRDILENGCRALGSFALYDETCLDVAQAGATKTVVDSIKSPHSDVCVKECCFWALACLTSKAPTCEELVPLGGLNVLVDTMEQFPQEELLQEYGVRTLSHLGALEGTASRVYTKRVVSVLCSLHKHFPDNVELMENMMLALSLVAAVQMEVQEFLLACGGLKAVVAVMKSLEENPVVQENGCRILGNMAVKESLRKSTEQQGASQVVIAAMLNIDMCEDIQLYGCMALMNLTADFMDNKMRVKNNGAVPTLLTTIRNYPDNTEVALSALKTLGNLVDLEDACRQLLDDRGLFTIMHMAKNKNTDIQAFSALVLSGLTALPDLPVEEMLEIEETLVTMQAALPNNPDLALSMCQGLHNLLKSDVGLDTLVQTEWLAVVENTMNTFPTQTDIHLTACRIVGTVAMECQRSLRQTVCPLSVATIRTVLRSMRQFPAHKELQVVACGTLSCVSESFVHFRPVIMKEGGVRDVTAAMMSFPRDDRLHSVGLIALSYLLPVDVEVSPEQGKAVLGVISRSMSQFVELEDIQISACRAIEQCDIRDIKDLFAILDSVHSALRRHSGKAKVQKAASKVFLKFGGERAQGVVEEIIDSPSCSPREMWERMLQK